MQDEVQRRVSRSFCNRGTRAARGDASHASRAGAAHAPRPEFAITEHPIVDEHAVLAVRGEIDLFTGPPFKQALVASIEMGFVRSGVDLTETTFPDCAGLGALIGVLQRLGARHGALAIVNVNEPVATTFAATGMNQIFTILPTRDDALQAICGLNRRLNGAAARARGGVSRLNGLHSTVRGCIRRRSTGTR